VTSGKCGVTPFWTPACAGVTVRLDVYLDPSFLRKQESRSLESQGVLAREDIA